MGVDFRELGAFFVLADELHFARAAERLYVTPGRLSQIVRSLEHELGGPLFARTSRRVSLTPLGETFRANAQPAWEELTTAIADTKASALAVTMVAKVGYLYSIGQSLPTKLVAQFEARNPKSRVELIAFTTFDFAPLRRGEIDVELMWSPGGDTAAVTGDGFQAGPVLTARGRALILSTRHPLANRDRLSVEELPGITIIRVVHNGPAGFGETWAPRFTPSGERINQVDSGASDQANYNMLNLISIVARSMLGHLTVESIDKSYAHDGVAVIPIPDLPPCLAVPVWRPDTENATTRAVLDAATSLAARARVRRRRNPPGQLAAPQQQC